MVNNNAIQHDQLATWSAHRDAAGKQTQGALAWMKARAESTNVARHHPPSQEAPEETVDCPYFESDILLNDDGTCPLCGELVKA